MSTGFRPTEPDKPFLLAADVDGTLLGDETGALDLQALVRDYAQSFRLAVITGRSLASVQALVAERRLPPPDYIGSSVGTELLDCHDSANELGRRYAARASPDWNLETIYALGVGAGITRQEFAEGQPRFQAGFCWDGQPETLAAFYRRLAEQPGCSIRPCWDKYIEVLPQSIGKGDIVRFLQQALSFDPARVVVAGDSGNDRAMFETDFKGILPGNALAELKGAATRPWHYHSDDPAARGVLAGLCHFGFIEPE